MKYRHLTLEQRSQIEESLSSGLSLRQIGEIVGVHAPTVSRELRRNNIRGMYNYVKADRPFKNEMQQRLYFSDQG